MSIGERILYYRKKFGLSQEELGEKLFVSRQTVSMWEKDQTVPTIDNLMLLKNVFNISVDDLLTDKEESENGQTYNSASIDTICGALAYALGIKPPKLAAEKNFELSNYIDKVFDGEKADRVVMYNPDAIGQWIYEKYPEFFRETKMRTDKEIYLSTVMPSVTPVCFATMYTGVQPSVHGIQKYEQPVLTIETIFDSLIDAGKKIAIITYAGCSIAKIFLGRNLDYYHYPDGNISDVNAKAAELILRDEHDFIVIYNGNYDGIMHKNGPESAKALAELRVNDHIFSTIANLIRTNWIHHNTLLGFAMDHGCHEIDGNCGSHGLDMCDDINIVHLYKGYKREIGE